MAIIKVLFILAAVTTSAFGFPNVAKTSEDLKTSDGVLYRQARQYYGGLGGYGGPGYGLGGGGFGASGSNAQSSASSFNTAGGGFPFGGGFSGSTAFANAGSGGFAG